MIGLRKWHPVIAAVIVAAMVFLATQSRAASAFVVAEISEIYLKQHPPVSLNASDSRLLSIYRCFDPSLRPYLEAVPIIYSSSAQTAFSVYRRDDVAFIALSPDFFRTARQSGYWRDIYSKPPYNLQPDQPVFSEEFRLELLSHELMHIAQAHLQLSPSEFFSEVEQWYRDESYGRPTQPALGDEVQGNRSKYMLSWYLYCQAGEPDQSCDCGWRCMDYNERYKHAQPGVEEFAYIGDSLVCPPAVAEKSARLAELSGGVLNAYAGILDPSILALRYSASR